MAEQEPPGPGARDEASRSPRDEASPSAKKRRVAGGGRRVPPPRRRNAGVSFGAQHFAETSYYFEGGLRKVRPYYFDFCTYCKGRWVGRTLLHVFGSEFRAQPLSYYRAAARAGRLRLNEEPVQDLDIVLKNNDFLRNTVHRHEPPVTAQPVQILVENEEVVVVDKPSSLPVHPCGRFRHNSVIFILGKEHALPELHTIHRLDRMTSGVLMFAKTLEVSKRIDEQVRERQLEKEYVCRVVGEFPEHEVVCQEPILVVSYKVGVCRVDPKGKFCKTTFQRLSYNGRTSVVKCLPQTGRTHQIRVHLQYLGHPIVNDPIYNMEAWGPERGRGGKIDKTDEELLKALVEEHRSKQSLDILGISEEDVDCNAENKDCGSSRGCTKSGEADPILEGSCPSKDSEDPERDSEDPERDSEDPERDSKDPERDSEDPERDSKDPKRDSEDPERDSEDPERDSKDPERESEDPERDSEDPERDSEDPERDSEDPERDSKDPERDPEDSESTDVAAHPLNSESNLEMLEKNKELGSRENRGGDEGSERDPLCLECKRSRRDPSPQELVMYLHALRYKGAQFEYCSKMPQWAMEDWEE